MVQMLELPAGVNEITETLWAHGYEAYAVGGCVRDMVRGVVPHDYDITTAAAPEDVKRVFADRKVVETGLRYGTVTVLSAGIGYEITAFRKEGAYSDGRHPDSVAFGKSLREDLARRDFTINAMAYSRRTGLVDPFGGLQDLENGCIRCVGTPRDRFFEDGLRILRGLRFAVTLGFGIEPETSLAMHGLRQRIGLLSGERSGAELCSMLSGGKLRPVFSAYRDVIGELIPEFCPCFDFEQNNPWHRLDVYGHILESVDCCPSEDLTTRLALLLHDIEKPSCYTQEVLEDGSIRGHFHGHGQAGALTAQRILQRLRLSGTVIRDVTELVRIHDRVIDRREEAVKRLLRQVGKVQTMRLLDVRQGDMLAQSDYRWQERLEKQRWLYETLADITERGACVRLADLAINGTDILQTCGVNPGAQVGALLDMALEQVICGALPNRKRALLEYLLTMVQPTQTEAGEPPCGEDGGASGGDRDQTSDER